MTKYLYKKSIVRVKIYFILAMLIISCFHCKTQGYKNDLRKIKCISVFSEFQFARQDNGEIVSFKDSFNVYYFRDLILYKLPYQTDLTNVIMDTSGNVLEEKVLKSSTKYKFLIHKMGEEYGWKFDSSRAKNANKILVDSFLKVKLKLSDEVFYSANDSLIEVFKYNGINIVEKLIPKKKYNDTYNDTTYLFFSSGLNNIPYSFSKKLDSLKKIKLYKARLIYNPIYSKSNTLVTKGRELFFEFREIPLTDSQDIWPIIQKYKRLHF